MCYSKQRELVLQKVEQPATNSTAEEIFDLAAKECPGLSLVPGSPQPQQLGRCRPRPPRSIPGKADRFDYTLGWYSHLYCNCCVAS